MTSSGKGSRPRPFSVDQETFAKNWDAIFKKNKVSETDCPLDEKQDAVRVKNDYYDLGTDEQGC